jgi:hypothetical protein
MPAPNTRRLALAAASAALLSPLLHAAPAQAMSLEPGVIPWSELGYHVPVCWVDPGFDEAKQIIQQEVERTFSRPSRLAFAWREGCPSDGTEWWVRFKIYRDSYASLLGAQAGIAALASPTETWDFGAVITVDPDDRYGQDVVACVGRSVMARILGFRGVDCRGTNDGLRESHLAVLQAVYGRRPSRPTAMADLDGDGLDDLVAVNGDGIYALRSTGAGFTDWRQWSGAFYGQRETAFADVDGDGDDDAIAVNDDAIYVLGSDGVQLTAWAPWTWFPFWGERRTLFGDVDGDGRADAVAVGADHLWVVRSTGAGFGAIEWWGPRVGDAETTALADWDGDGLADLVTWEDDHRNDDDGLFVQRSTGGAFADRLTWRTGGLIVPTRGVSFRDASGDGRADAVFANWRAGYGYAAVPLSRPSFYPDIGYQREPTLPRGGYGLLPRYEESLLGDVDGDGSAELVIATDVDVRVKRLDTTGVDHPQEVWWDAPFYALWL